MLFLYNNQYIRTWSSIFNKFNRFGAYFVKVIILANMSTGFDGLYLIWYHNLKTKKQRSKINKESNKQINRRHRHAIRPTTYGLTYTVVQHPLFPRLICQTRPGRTVVVLEICRRFVGAIHRWGEGHRVSAGGAVLFRNEINIILPYPSIR